MTRGSQRRARRLSRTALVGVLALAVTGVPAAPSDVAVAAPETAAYVPVGPLRLADTRRADCGCVALDADTIRVAVTSRGAVPDDAIAVAITVTALPTERAAFVTAYPSGVPLPPTSTVNTRSDRAVANSAIIPVGSGGALDVYSRLPGDVVVDITGAFVPADSARSGRFVATEPVRLYDTREVGEALAPGGTLTIPLHDAVDPGATALAVNVTSTGERRPGHLSARPAGARRWGTSFLNATGSGHAVASATILPVLPDGLSIYSHGGGDVVVDLVGWFTGPSAAEGTDGLFVPLEPTRLLDTRTAAGRIWPRGTIELESPVVALALVTNLTATAADWRGHVTAYPAGTTRPHTSSLNPTFHDHTVANLAITRTSERGLAYYSLSGVDAIVDLTGYFTGTPVAAPQRPEPNTRRTPRMLIVGDSAMAGLIAYPDAQRALVGMEWVLDADNCRRLVHPSCVSPVTNRAPPTALETIRAAPGSFDIVYIDVGHNDWHDPDFFDQFRLIVEAARAKGAKVVLWATYTVNVRYDTARAAYIENNRLLREFTSLPAFPDAVLADWNAYATPRPEWFYDGTHMEPSGAFGQADFLSRWAAAVMHVPCQRPWEPGGPIPDPCPHPEWVGPPTDPIALYR